MKKYTILRLWILGVICSIVVTTNGNTSQAGPVLNNLKLGFYKTDVEFIAWDLNEKFSKENFNYTATVEKSYTAVVQITPEINPTSGITIRINGNDAKPNEQFRTELNPGSNVFNIVLIGSDGVSSEYRLSVEQKDLSKVYVSQVVAPGVWRIRDFGGFAGSEDMYLIEGKDKALLFDTGMGTGDLAGYIKKLTKLPVDVAITHGNRDHFAQLDQFKGSTVYISEKDITRLSEELITPSFKMVGEGDIIDIGGGRRFEVIEIPGHTLGCLVFLDRANKIAVVGDGVGSGERVHMYGTACAALDQYHAGLRKAEEKIKDIDGLTLLVGHHYQENTPLTGQAGKQLFTDMRILAEKILKGEITGKAAFTSRNGVTQEFRQAYYGLAGLWFNQNNMVTHPASLGDLRVKTIEGKFIITTPVFSSFITSFTATVKESNESINIIPFAYSADIRSLSVNGKSVNTGSPFSVSLERGVNKIDISLVGKDGSARNYILSVTR